MTFICYSSILTIRILKKRYLAHVQGDTLSPEAKSFMKQVVQEEILKMQVPDVSNAGGRLILCFVWFLFFSCWFLCEDNDNSEGEVDYQKAQRKRKRTSELLIDKEHEFVAKKSRQSPSLSGKFYSYSTFSCCSSLKHYTNVVCVNNGRIKR